MRNLLQVVGVVLLTGTWAVCASTSSHAAGSTQVNVPKVSVRLEDVQSIDGLMRALYEVLSGPSGQARDWSRDRTLYLEDCRFIWWEAEASGKVHMVNVDHQSAVDLINAEMVEKGYFVREIDRSTHINGNLAQVFSTYEARYMSDGPVVERGINSLQLVNDGKRWWVMALAFDEEKLVIPNP